ncbi:MAG: hypothetical protein H6729_04120 [Deltaproteobacteria bacterium]|nr:hypothetical protein [Deltaproteobacteria bacterium]
MSSKITLRPVGSERSGRRCMDGLRVFHRHGDIIDGIGGKPVDLASSPARYRVVNSIPP